MDARGILKHLKAGIMLPPQLKDDGDFDGNTEFDCQGLAAVLILIIVGTLDTAVGSTAETAAPKLEECDTSGGSFTDISGAALSDVIAATDDDKLFGIFLDRTVGDRKRFIQVNAPHAGNGTTGANMAVVALGFPADTLPKSASEMGLVELIES